MRAVIIPRTGGPEVLDIVDQPDPEPGPGEVVIRNRAAGLNQLDILIRRGGLPADLMPDLPMVPGVEAAGEVVAAGPDVTRLREGQRVVWFGRPGSGAQAELSLVNAHFVLPIPDRIDYTTAAAIPVNYITAYHMLMCLTDLQENDWVLVHGGAGGVGTAAIQLARHAGACPIACVGTARRDAARQAGALAVIDREKDDIAREVLRATSGRGVKVALNPIGGDTVARDLTVLSPLGQVISYGFMAGQPTGHLADLMPLFTRSVGLRLFDVYTLYAAEPEFTRIILQRLLTDLAAGHFAPRIHEVVPMAEAARAHQMMEAREIHGKVVLGID